MSNVIPTEIKNTSRYEISVRWNDGHSSLFSTRLLRIECTCAGCINEVTGERILDPATISDEITVTAAEHVGRYGVKFTFSDGHDDGIYTWKKLRELCPCPGCLRDRTG